MRLLVTSGLLLVLCGAAAAQTASAGWKVVKDGNGVCQVAVPPDWAPGSTPGTASIKNMLEGMVVITSDVDRLQPMPEAVQKLLVQHMIENTAQRVFYSNQTGMSQQYDASVPGKDGKGRCHASVTFQSGKVTDEVARQIALSIGPVK